MPRDFFVVKSVARWQPSSRYSPPHPFLEPVCKWGGRWVKTFRQHLERVIPARALVERVTLTLSSLFFNSFRVVFVIWPEIVWVVGVLLCRILASWRDIRRLQSVFLFYNGSRVVIGFSSRSFVGCTFTSVWLEKEESKKKKRKLVPASCPPHPLREFAHISSFRRYSFLGFFMARWPTFVAALALFAAVSTAETQGKMMTNLILFIFPFSLACLCVLLNTWKNRFSSWLRHPLLLCWAIVVGGGVQVLYFSQPKGGD